MHRFYPPDYPEEYATGKVRFFGRDFFVTPDVLIPRLESECLVRRARALIQRHHIDSIVDIGCGSGILGLSCLDILHRGVFLDISPYALLIAKKNFQNLYREKQAQFLVSDLLDEYLPPHNALLIANLPYIKRGDWKNMSPDTRFEPEIALFGGENTGFEIYERLFRQLYHIQYRGYVLIEFGFDQREISEKVIQHYDWKYQFFEDYSGIQRFCQINLT